MKFFFSEKKVLFYEKTYFLLKSKIPKQRDLRPDLSGALFARRHDEQKSGNGGRIKLPK